jgi:hypothetical protein
MVTFHGAERPGSEVDHSPPSSTDVQDDRSCCMHSWCEQGKVYLLSSNTVIPNLRYAHPQGYEPGHLGVREKMNNGGKRQLLGYSFTLTKYKFETTATI